MGIDPGRYLSQAKRGWNWHDPTTDSYNVRHWEWIIQQDVIIIIIIIIRLLSLLFLPYSTVRLISATIWTSLSNDMLNRWALSIAGQLHASAFVLLAVLHQSVILIHYVHRQSMTSELGAQTDSHLPEHNVNWLTSSELLYRCGRSTSPIHATTPRVTPLTVTRCILGAYLGFIKV